ncbi:MAG TPA: glycosyltransferase family 2 protein [Chloroflexota bacterium]|nr:glycosyltransferase family 2 protein [Chloroflexota bacterium]
MTPRVSVALPVWNAEAFLPAAIESILSQTLADLELVVVDDGSTDRTAAILSDFQSRDQRLVVHRQANSGFVSAVNCAVELCSSAYVARMDADDIAVPDRLERQWQFLERHPDVGVVGGAVVIIDSGGTALTTWQTAQSDKQLRAALETTNPFCDPAMMLRRSALRKVGGYRGAFGSSADYDLWLRISERYALGALSVPVLRYRWHADQLSTRDVHAQLLGLVAARHASRLRRATGADPFDDTDVVTVERLSQSGLDPEWLQSELLWEAAARAAALVSIGRPRDARVLLDHALSLAPAHTRISRTSRAHARIAYARARASESAVADAVRWLVIAGALDPAAVGRAAWRGLRQWGARI